jgi:hypothetical protein
MDAIDLKRGWVNYHRPKTGIDRRCPLWPEKTMESPREAIAARPTPKAPEDAALVFVTGRDWLRTRSLEYTAHCERVAGRETQALRVSGGP